MKLPERNRKKVSLYELEGESNFLSIFKNKENRELYTSKGVFRGKNKKNAKTNLKLNKNAIKTPSNTPKKSANSLNKQNVKTTTTTLTITTSPAPSAHGPFTSFPSPVFASTSLLACASKEEPPVETKQKYPIGIIKPTEDTNGWSTLHFAAALGYEDKVREIIDAASPTTPSSSPSSTSSSSSLSLSVAPPSVKDMLANVAEGKTRATPLRVAAVYGRLGVVRYLCEVAGAADRLHEAEYADDNEVNAKSTTSALPNYVIDNFSNSGGSPLFIAAANGHLDVVKYFCEEAAGVHKYGLNGRLVHVGGGGGKASRRRATPAAAAAATTTITKWTKFIYNPHYRRPSDLGVPLHIAAQNGQLDVVKYLYESCGADPAAVRETGASSLYAAAYHGRDDVVRYLVEVAKVDPMLRTHQGETAEDGARKASRHSIASYLANIVKK